MTQLPFLSWGEPLVEARFVRRPNRFVVEARLWTADAPASDAPSGQVNNPSTASASVASSRVAEHGTDPRKGSEVVAHLADPGRLKELLVPGRRMGLRPEAPSSTRTTRWTALLVESPDGSGWVSLNTTMPNRLVRAALASGVLSELREWRLAGWEVPYGSSRLDFLLEREEGRRMYLEAKSVTLVEDGVALFPDAVTARGARHLEELIRAREEGHEAAVLFVLQRPDALRIVAARAIDPAFADTLSRAEKAGVRVLGRRCSVTWEGIRLGARVRAEAG